MTSINDVLINSYRETNSLILKDPANKNNIISEYIDLVYKVYTESNGGGDGAGVNANDNSELSKMLKNPLEISIYNNFQRYNDGTNDNIINPILKNNNNDNKLNKEIHLQQLLIDEK
jgi:hypothetical protein